MNRILGEYLENVGRYLSPRRSGEILAELTDLIESRVEEAAKAEGREPSDDDYRAAIGRLGEPAQVAAGYSRERYLVGPEYYGPFFAYLGIVFSVHVGISLLALIFNTGVLVLPGIGAGPFAGGIGQFLASLPGNFIFDFGLVALIMWQIGRHNVKIPFPSPVKVKLPSMAEMIVSIIGGLVMLAILNFGRDFLFRVWIAPSGESYRILGPGFERGLPLLNIVVGVGLAIDCVSLAVRDVVGRRALKVVHGITSLIGIGLFFAIPDIVRIPAAANLPDSLTTLLPKLVAVPVMIALVADLIFSVLALWQDAIAVDA